jgi:(p)ppGpp synthase/HD superfamily hydrolase
MVFKAIKFVAEAHQGHYRKGTNIPYISHLMNVMKILCEIGCNKEVITAGILHDVVEDTSVSIEEVERIFGKRVASIVEGASEPDHIRNGPNGKGPWRLRKQHTIGFISKEATLEQLLVLCADKVDNTEAIRHDFILKGEKLWERFNAPKGDQQWYYTSIAAAFEQRSIEFGEPLSGISKKLTDNVNVIFGIATKAQNHQSPPNLM